MKKVSNTRELASRGPAVVEAVRNAFEVIGQAAPTYEMFRSELARLIQETEMHPEARGLMLTLMNHMETNRQLHLRADELIMGAHALTAAAVPALRLGVKQKKGGSSSGRVRTKKAAEWHSKCIDDAKRLLESGKDSRGIASLLAKRFRKSERQVRSVLKKAAVK